MDFQIASHVLDLRQIVEEAGVRILHHYKKATTVALKADDSPLTAADQASHHYIADALARLAPGVTVISEESESKPDQVQNQPFWLVDPLDGTKEFLKGTDEFTVNIALIENRVPVFGIVYAPAIQLSYWAIRNEGAWRHKTGENIRQIKTKPFNSHETKVVASKDHRGPQLQAMIDRMPQAKCVSMGSSLKFCLVAEAAADIYFRDVGTMEWDTAAAQCVVETAGGVVLDLSGSPLRYGKPEFRNGSLMTIGDPSANWKSWIQ